MQVHPQLKGNSRIEEQMLAWAAHHVRTYATEELELSILIDMDDMSSIALFEQHGFRQRALLGVLMERDLQEPIPEVHVSSDVTIRHVAHGDEYVERVNVHRDAFAPSSFTLQAYQRLRAVPGYIPELDLVGVVPDGSFSSFCLCWFDSLSQRGLFEPVGTRPQWQRRGYGRAVLHEGLRRLRAYGAKTAVVGTAIDHIEAIHLFESVGMRIIKREYQYLKQV